MKDCQVRVEIEELRAGAQYKYSAWLGHKYRVTFRAHGNTPKSALANLRKKVAAILRLVDEHKLEDGQ